MLGVDSWQGYWLSCWSALALCDCDLTFDLGVVILTFKILCELYRGKHKV